MWQYGSGRSALSPPQPYPQPSSRSPGTPQQLHTWSGRSPHAVSASAVASRPNPWLVYLTMAASHSPLSPCAAGGQGGVSMDSARTAVSRVSGAGGRTRGVRGVSDAVRRGALSRVASARSPRGCLRVWESFGTALGELGANIEAKICCRSDADALGGNQGSQGGGASAGGGGR
jgi:hypothetical protein